MEAGRDERQNSQFGDGGFCRGHGREASKDENGEVVKLDEDRVRAIRDERLERNGRLPEVSVSVLKPEMWLGVMSGRFRQRDAIRNLEARSLLSACDSVSNVQGLSGESEYFL